jgi:hypothetical protein
MLRKGLKNAIARCIGESKNFFYLLYTLATEPAVLLATEPLVCVLSTSS